MGRRIQRKEIISIVRQAQAASREMLSISSVVKNKVLTEMAAALRNRKSYILKANRKDLKYAQKKGCSGAFLDRLELCNKGIKQMSESLIQIARLKDPVGAVIRSWRRPNGLAIKKVRVPIGVIAIIYESRPNVTADCVGLCFKTANALILRGGSESINSNLSIYRVLEDVLKKYEVPAGAINMIKTTDRRAVDMLLKFDNYIDLVIPRGGESLVRKVAAISRIPVIKHYKGICHIYVDDQADLNLAEKVCFNAKVQRPGTCNAMETMLVHKDIAARFLPGMLKKFKTANVQIRGCPVTGKIARNLKIRSASEKDYSSEYLDLILSVKVVDDLESAIRHINYYGTRHSDAIITDNSKNAEEFLQKVDSACVYVNTSTRFTDGYQFGLGAEMGISTDKLHARGPMALEELTTYKYMVFGKGQIRV